MFGSSGVLPQIAGRILPVMFFALASPGGDRVTAPPPAAAALVDDTLALNASKTITVKALEPSN